MSGVHHGMGIMDFYNDPYGKNPIDEKPSIQVGGLTYNSPLDIIWYKSLIFYDFVGNQ